MFKFQVVKKYFFNLSFPLGSKRSAVAGDGNQGSIGRRSEAIYNSNVPDNIDPEYLEPDGSDESQVLQTELINVSTAKPRYIVPNGPNPLPRYSAITSL